MDVSERIFKKLDAMKDEFSFSEEESRAAVVEIVEVLQKRNITYGCAREIITAVQTTLDEMSRSIQL